MASDFCYVATGQPGLGRGQWGLGEGGPAGGPRVARAETSAGRGFNSSTMEGRGGWLGAGAPLGSLWQVGRCPWGTEWSASLPPQHLPSHRAPDSLD